MTQYFRVYTKQFRKDLQRLRKSGRNLDKLEYAITLLASDQKLLDRYRDHELKGSMKGMRECHIAPDWLLVYQKYSDQLLLLLLRTGTHRDVLGIE